MMATGAALEETDVSNDGDLEAARDRHRQAEAMPWGNRLAAAINTARHVHWLFASLLPSSILHRMLAWLTSVRRSLRNIDYDSPMDPDLVNQLVRESLPSYYELQAQDKELATECLKYYNARHPGSEYVLASGEVTQLKAATNYSGAWIHGNFVARQRKAWCCSFLYGPQTLFFFELNGPECHGGIVSCTPLDEPVTEPCSFLGFPLWCSKRRSGIYDCVCKTCGSCLRHSGTRRCPDKTRSCGHEKVAILCNMCHHRSNVLHPSPAEFQCGHQKGATFSYFSTCA